MLPLDLMRLALLLFFLVFMPLGLYHRLRADSGESIDRWQEGVVILFGLRLCAAVMAVAVLVWMVAPSRMDWSAIPLPWPLRFGGVAVAGLGGCVMVWAMHHLGRNLTDTVVTRRQHTLVTEGPYRWIRHPFYLAALLISVGVSLATANWLVALMTLAGAGFILARTRIEEQKLRERFGDEYQAYRQRVGAIWPRFRTR